MKKMPTLFIRQFSNARKIKATNKVTPGCEWVLNGEGWATEKFDGTCCLIEKGVLYKRFDLKMGRILPYGAIPCQNEPDPITGHFPHWVKVNEYDPQDKWFVEAFKKCKNLEDGTYELVGEHFRGNPYKLKGDKFIKHGSVILENVPRDFDGIWEYLRKNKKIEGIVFYRENGEMCKIKRTDFNLKFPFYNKKNIITSKVIMEIKELFEKGESPNKIYTKLNISQTSVRNILRQLGYDLTKNKKTSYKYINDKKRNKYIIHIYDFFTETLLKSYYSRKEFLDKHKSVKACTLDRAVWRFNHSNGKDVHIRIDGKTYGISVEKINYNLPKIKQG